ncbi:MAG: hypothetical protein FJ275_07075 [Planctomycetes bacterium]|nr:hypothetical protein [Planctomycetota bacterium]
MPKELIAFEVDAGLRQSLVEEARGRGVRFEDLCHALLTVALADHGRSGVKEREPEVLSFASLALLRDEVRRVEIERPEGWRSTLARLNSEISRRFRV